MSIDLTGYGSIGGVISSNEYSACTHTHLRGLSDGPLLDDDGNDVFGQPLGSYRRPLAKKPARAMMFTVAIGDASKLIAPGAVEKLRVFPQQMFQLVKIELAQYPAHDAGGLACDAGGPCWWPIELCYVGDRAIGGPQGLHTGSCEPVTCQLGQCIELMVRNPLSVPAAVYGALIGRTISRAVRPLSADHLERVPPPLTAAQLEALVRQAAGSADDFKPVICSVCGGPTTGSWQEIMPGQALPVNYCKACWDRREIERQLAVYHAEVVNAVTVDGAVYQRVRIGPDTADPEALVFPSASPGWFWKRTGRNFVEPERTATTPWVDVAPAPRDDDDVWRCVGCGSNLKRSPDNRHWDDPISGRCYCTPCWQRRAATKPASRTVIYCEHAPPRAVVEHVIVRCGTGLEGGQPVMAPLVWTWAMRQAWERHEAWKVECDRLRDVAVACNDTKAMVRLLESHSDWELVPPVGADAYGGGVIVAPGTGKGARCRLCGGWIRSVSL